MFVSAMYIIIEKKKSLATLKSKEENWKASSKVA